MTGKHGTLQERFWRYVERGADCWEWTGSRSDGYGTLRTDRSCIKAHRVSWILHKGPVPEGSVIRHRCDNAGCVNPDHLELGTQRDNMRDAMVRGRLTNRVRGEQHYRARLTAAAVARIRELAAAGRSRASIAREFEIAQVTVWRVLTGQSWRHVGAPK